MVPEGVLFPLLFISSFSEFSECSLNPCSYDSNWSFFISILETLLRFNLPNNFANNPFGLKKELFFSSGTDKLDAYFSGYYYWVVYKKFGALGVVGVPDGGSLGTSAFSIFFRKDSLSFFLGGSSFFSERLLDYSFKYSLF